jgi:nucleoside-diphosphate-sugar epimerase
MRVLISGASGFIGSALIQCLSQQGFEVIALSRTGHVNNFSGTVIKWCLGDSIHSNVASSIDCAIHLAYDFRGKQGARISERETVSFISLLNKQGVPRQLVFSSYSSGEHASSRYGQTKYQIEQSVAKIRGVVIVRPGLVIGDGGIFGRIKKWAQRLPVIPLPDGGEGKVPVITWERLCDEIIKMIESPGHLKETNLFNPDLITLRQLVTDAASSAAAPPRILSVPSSFFLFFLRSANFLRLPLPVNADNLMGFLSNQHAQHKSSLGDGCLD